jgi:hypothetical protein
MNYKKFIQKYHLICSSTSNYSALFLSHSSCVKLISIQKRRIKVFINFVEEKAEDFRPEFDKTFLYSIYDTITLIMEKLNWNYVVPFVLTLAAVLLGIIVTYWYIFQVEPAKRPEIWASNWMTFTALMFTMLMFIIPNLVKNKK